MPTQVQIPSVSIDESGGFFALIFFQFVMVCIGLFYTILESNRQQKSEYNLIILGLGAHFVSLVLQILSQQTMVFFGSPMVRILSNTFSTTGFIVLVYGLLLNHLRELKQTVQVVRAFWIILAVTFIAMTLMTILSPDVVVELIWLPPTSNTSPIYPYTGEWIYAFQQIFILLFALVTLITQTKEKTFYSQGFLLFMVLGRLSFIFFLIGNASSIPASAVPRLMSGILDPLGFLFLIMAINQLISENLTYMLTQISRRAKLLEQSTRSLTKLNQISTNLLKTTQISDIAQTILSGLSHEFGFVHAFLLLLDRDTKILQGIRLNSAGDTDYFMQLDIRQEHFLTEALLKGKSLFFGEGSRVPDKKFIDDFKYSKNLVTVPLLTKKEATCFNMHGCDKVSCPIKMHGINACWLAKDECPFYDPEQAASIGPCIDCKAFNVVGLLVLDNRGAKSKVDEDNLAFIETFANQAGMAIHNASLVEDLSREVTFRERTFKSLPNGVMVLDERGIIQSLNPSLLNILEMTRKDVTGIPFEAVRLVNDEEKFHAIVNKVIVEGKSYEGIGESWTLALPGRTLKLNIKVNPLPGTGSKHGAVILFEDITDVSQLQEQLVRSEKLATVGQMAAGIAHEVNNPLAGVSGFLQVMASRLPEDSPERHAMQAALKDIKRASGTIQDLLKFARLGPSFKRPNELNEIIEESMVFIHFQKEYQNIKIVRNFSENLPQVVCDPDQMRQVFTNLILNALHAMGENGTLTITTASMNGFVRVFIEDTGSGIPPDKFESIFEPWFTTKQSKGTGLGLANCDTILSEHQGTLAFSSMEGVGTTFIVNLNAYSGNPQDNGQA